MSDRVFDSRESIPLASSLRQNRNTRKASKQPVRQLLNHTPVTELNIIIKPG